MRLITGFFMTVVNTKEFNSSLVRSNEAQKMGTFYLQICDVLNQLFILSGMEPVGMNPENFIKMIAVKVKPC